MLLPLLGALLACSAEQPDASMTAVRSGSDELLGRPAAEKAALTAAREEVHARRLALAQAEAAVERARGELVGAEKQLGRLVGERPSDGDLFRAIQQLLLVDPALVHVAIAAEVAQGVVILRGSAPDGHTAEVAQDLVRGVRGVVDIRNEIRIVDQRPGPR